MMLTRAEHRRALGGGALSLAAVFAFVALATLALIRFDAGSTAATPLLDPYILRVLRFTLVQALLSALLSVLLAIPVVRALARQQQFPGRIWIVRLMAVPMGLPVLIGALGLIGIWGRHGVLNTALAGLGLAQPLSIYGLGGILLAHVFFNLPLACRLLLAGLERVPAEYWRMAASLGMTPLSIFRFIEWPVLRRLIPGVAGLIFMLCATSFTLVLTLGGGPAATTIEVAIYQALRFDFDPQRAVGLALLQIAVTGLILAAMALFPAPSDEATTTGKASRRLDGASIFRRLSDGLVIFLATLLVGAPLLMVLIAGLKADFSKLFADPLVWRAAATSFALSISAGLLAVLVALAIVQALGAIRDRKRRTVPERAFAATLSATSSLVLLVPPVVLATGWFLLLLPTGRVADFAPLLVIVINMLMALPFVTRVLAPAYEIHVTRTGRLAASLGLTGLPRVRLIDWPGLRRPLLMAPSFGMALSLGDLGAVALFGSDQLMTLPWLVYSRLGSYRTDDADGLALLLGVICLGLTIAGTLGQPNDKEHSAHGR